MYSDNKQIRDVADVAAKIMYGQQPVTEKLHPNQQQLDVHEPEKDELTSDDFKKLRAKKEVKKEEVEELDEEDAYEKDRYAVKNGKAVKDNPTHQGSPNYKDQPHHVYATSAENALKNHTKKEEVEQIDIEEGAKETAQKALNLADKLRKKDPEKSKMYRNLGIKASQRSNNPTGVKSGQPHGSGNKALRKQGIEPVPSSISSSKMRGYFEEVESIDEVKMSDLPSTKVQGRSYGASKPEPHAVDTLRGPKEKELKDIEAEKKKKQKKFSEMVNLYQEKGLKSLSEMLVKEEPDNEQFTKELEDAKARSEGKKRNTEIAKGAVQAVKQEELDINDINGVQMSTIEERMMTEPEKEKKEDIVKSMKKGMSGFKDRYGDRAKNVMYATATKQAMKD